jgi:transcriptional regulator of aromatic amino acid metabolism
MSAANEFLAPSPVVYVDGARPELPRGPVGTIVVRNVARLTPRHQNELLAWINAERRDARIVAISARRLFPKVKRREFSERLYYRLNTIVVPLTPRRSVFFARPVIAKADR